MECVDGHGRKNFQYLYCSGFIPDCLMLFFLVLACAGFEPCAVCPARQMFGP